MTSLTIREAWTGEELSIGSPAAWARDVAFAALVGLWIGALGPFGNFYAGPLGVRLTFHLAIMAANVVALGLAIRLAIWGGRQLGITPWIATPAAIVIACVPLSAIAELLGVALFPHLEYVLSPFDWYFQTLLLLLPIGCAYVAALVLIQASATGSTSTPPNLNCAPRAATRPRLHGRLTSSTVGEIVALSAEDHYVRIHTVSGSQLLLMRLSDAIAEMDDAEGLRTHRSWWVSRHAIHSMQLDRRGGRLTLQSGLEVPVARSALGRLRDVNRH